MKTREAHILPVFTLVLWLTCLAIGIAGILLADSRAAPPATQPAGIVPVTMDVRLERIPPPPETIVPPTPPEVSPQSVADISPQIADPPPMAVAAVPALPEVAAPSPAIAFEQPVDGPVRFVAARQAAPVQSAPRMTVAKPQPPKVVHLTFGEGQGNQPAPEYPRQAALAHQTGTVVVHFTAGEDGRVISARIATPCPWPLLNQAALQTVRESWRLPGDGVREFDVSIEFQVAGK